MKSARGLGSTRGLAATGDEVSGTAVGDELEAECEASSRISLGIQEGGGSLYPAPMETQEDGSLSPTQTDTQEGGLSSPKSTGIQEGGRSMFPATIERHGGGLSSSTPTETQLGKDKDEQMQQWLTT